MATRLLFLLGTLAAWTAWISPTAPLMAQAGVLQREPASIEHAATRDAASAKRVATGDVMVFREGSGHDTVRDATRGLQGQGGKRCDTGGTLDFEGVWMDRVHLSFTEGALVIHYSDTDSVTIMGFNPRDAYCGGGTYNFGGASLTYRELIDLGFDLTGTPMNDTIYGTSAVDRIYGYAGNDTLISYDGNDTLAGGSGNDSLDGGPGDDNYLYGLGDGVDRIADPVGDDRIKLGVGIYPDNVVLRLDASEGGVLRLRLIDTTGRAYPDQGIDMPINADGSWPIEHLVFPNGAKYTPAELLEETKARLAQ